jgi:hypothetical protein
MGKKPLGNFIPLAITVTIWSKCGIGGGEVLNILTTFEKLRQEHEVIQVNTHLISNSADSLQTLSGLQGNSADFTEYQVNFLSDKRVNLKRAIISLKDGLIEHQRYEEEVLQSLVGSPLIEVLKREHQEVLEKLTEIDWMLLNISPVGILFNSSFLKQKIDALCQELNAGCARENSILELLVRLPEN